MPLLCDTQCGHTLAEHEHFDDEVQSIMQLYAEMTEHSNGNDRPFELLHKAINGATKDSELPHWNRVLYEAMRAWSPSPSKRRNRWTEKLTLAIEKAEKSCQKIHRSLSNSEQLSQFQNELRILEDVIESLREELKKDTPKPIEKKAKRTRQATFEPKNLNSDSRSRNNSVAQSPKHSTRVLRSQLRNEAALSLEVKREDCLTNPNFFNEAPAPANYVAPLKSSFADRLNEQTTVVNPQPIDLTAPQNVATSHATGANATPTAAVASNFNFGQPNKYGVYQPATKSLFTFAPTSTASLAAKKPDSASKRAGEAVENNNRPIDFQNLTLSVSVPQLPLPSFATAFHTPTLPRMEENRSSGVTVPRASTAVPFQIDRGPGFPNPSTQKLFQPVLHTPGGFPRPSQHGEGHPVGFPRPEPQLRAGTMVPDVARSQQGTNGIVHVGTDDSNAAGRAILKAQLQQYEMGMNQGAGLPTLADPASPMENQPQLQKASTSGFQSDLPRPGAMGPPPPRSYTPPGSPPRGYGAPLPRRRYGATRRIVPNNASTSGVTPKPFRIRGAIEDMTDEEFQKHQARYRTEITEPIASNVPKKRTLSSMLADDDSTTDDVYEEFGWVGKRAKHIGTTANAENQTTTQERTLPKKAAGGEQQIHERNKAVANETVIQAAQRALRAEDAKRQAVAVTQKTNMQMANATPKRTFTGGSVPIKPHPSTQHQQPNAQPKAPAKAPVGPAVVHQAAKPPSIRLVPATPIIAPEAPAALRLGNQFVVENGIPYPIRIVPQNLRSRVDDVNAQLAQQYIAQNPDASVYYQRMMALAGDFDDMEDGLRYVLRK